MCKSVYIHIPFCKKKCKYCSFVSFENRDKKKGYLYSLLKEIDYYYKNEELETFYIGGGTPSVVDISELEMLIKPFYFKPDCEKTIELNPDDITQQYTQGLKNLGFNRVSIGAQSFDDDILKSIGRRHSSKQTKTAVDILKQVGFDNINIDLIYGLPNQSRQKWIKDLKTALELDIQHLSLYGLKIDEGSYFYKNPPENLPDEDTQADMYLDANRIIKEYGFLHYEISNYSKKGYNSRHNTNYWKCNEYYGFGVSAAGYQDGIRYSNTNSLEDYLNNPTLRKNGKFLTQTQQLEETIFLGLRLEEGIDVNFINEKFDIDFENKYKKPLEKYLTTKHLLKTKKGYKLNNSESSNGFLLSNIILSEFMN